MTVIKSFHDDLCAESSLGFQCSFSKALYLEQSWRVFHDRLLLGRCFRGFVLPILEYCSAVRCSAADTHISLWNGLAEPAVDGLGLAGFKSSANGLLLPELLAPF